MTRLIFLDADVAGQVHELASEKITIGRDASNDLTLLHPSVSARHCELLVHGPEVIVRDLDSRNGVFVDGTRVNGQCQVKSGQVIRVGSVSARLQLELPPRPDDATAITAVYSFRRHAAKMEKETEVHPPKHVSLQPVAGEAPDAGDHTVLMARPPAPRPASTAPAATPLPKSARPAWVWILLGAALVVGLVVLAWFVWGRK